MGFRLDVPWSRLAPKVRKTLLEGYRGPGPRPLQEPLRARAVVLHDASRASIPYVERRHAEAETDTSRERFEGFMREVPCPACQGSRLKPVVAGRDARRQVDRRRRGPADRRVRRLPARPRAVTARGADRGARPQGGQRAAAVPARRRPRLPRPGPAVRQRSRGERRSGSGSRRRSVPGWSGSSTCSTSPRSGCTSGTTTGSSRRCCGCATSATRSSSSSTTRTPSRRRTGSSTSARVRASTGAGRRVRHRRRPARVEGLVDGRLSGGSSRDRAARRTPPAHAGSQASWCKALASTTCATSTSSSRWAASSP